MMIYELLKRLQLIIRKWLGDHGKKREKEKVNGRGRLKVKGMGRGKQKVKARLGYQVNKRKWKDRVKGVVNLMM